MPELIVRGGTIVDGTGGPTRLGDVAVDEGRITAVGEVDGKGRREIDADGLLVTPGWVDIHTHYDGQVTWDPEVTPSSWHGVTTVVMGNCGVGFAPVRPDGQSFLIELMEGVEDIPGTALHEGIDWQWESFPEYLDALDSTPRAIDIAAQMPHAALRAYVMGERAHDNEASADDVATMAQLTYEALVAGAAGFSTSRTVLHSSKHGFVPGTYVSPDEVLAIGDAFARAGHGVFQMVSDGQGAEPERSWLETLARDTGATITYALAQSPLAPDAYRAALDDADRFATDGLRIVPQVSSRPTGMLFGLQSSLHPFITHPTYRALSKLPLAERVAKLRTAEIREALLAEKPGTSNVGALVLMSRWNQIFPLSDPPDYEPSPDRSVAATAEREQRSPEAVVLDWLLEADGKAFLFAPLASYVDFDHEVLREMMTHPRTVLGLSDGGAHCGLICDASMTTFLLTHWVRDREHGPRLPLEQAVHLQTQRTARTYGFRDRGTIEPGARADLNVIDLDAMRLHVPEMTFDLPAGGRRLVQRVDGYRATIVAGETTFENGEPTGRAPGAWCGSGTASEPERLVKVEIVGRYLSTLPDDDDHPYRTGPWQPNLVEYDATDLDVTGELPDDLNGVYLRNTENPVHQSIGRYHPFDGDGMVHAIHFRDGHADYRNRFVRTVGFEDEQAAGTSLWAGLAESPKKSVRADGWGARGRMKDASSTDVVVHAGKALTSFYQCGDLYELDPITLQQLGHTSWDGRFPSDIGVSAHTKVDEATGELLFFNYSTVAPYLHYGVVDASGRLAHYTDVPLPGPRLPHDMAFTEHYAILNDCPLFWDEDLLARGVHAARFHPDLPTRFAIVPRRGGEPRWFEAEPTYVLHWINAYEDGDEVVLDGYFQGDPAPADRGENGFYESLSRFLSLERMQTRPHRWRFDLRTGQTKEEDLSDQILEFGTINNRHGGQPYRYVYNVTGVPGRFLFDGLVKLDLETGEEDRYAFGPGVFGSEAPMAPGAGTAEDDGYVVTFVTDMNDDRSECLVLDARDLAAGPVARVALPERISSGTHACWAATPLR